MTLYDKKGLPYDSQTIAINDDSFPVYQRLVSGRILCSVFRKVKYVTLDSSLCKKYIRCLR